MRQNYPAFMLRDDDKCTVVFPDLPGCLTFADTPSDAFTAAQEALEGHLAAMIEEGMSLPDPSSLEEVRPDAEEEPYLISTILVPANTSTAMTRTNITIEEGLLERIDAITSNRSAFFTDAARNELARRRSSRTPTSSKST